MDKQYFLIIEGRQHGPYPWNELRQAGLTADTPVWREGLDNWVKASTLPELNELLYVTPPQAGPIPPSYSNFPPYSGPENISGFNQNNQDEYYQQPYNQYGYDNYSRPGYGPLQPGEPIAHTNWMPWAILATVLGCFGSCISLILGIIAITYASKANNLYNSGDEYGGRDANGKARTMTIISFVITGLAIIFVIAMLPSILNEL